MIGDVLLEVDLAAIIIYTVAFFGWFVVWHYLVGYNWLMQRKLLWVSFLGCLLVFGVNIVLGFYAKTPDYKTELMIYPYVEQNAKTVASLALAIAIFVVVRFDKEADILQTPSSRKFLMLIFWAFLFALVGCLPLYWMPPVDGWLTALRHLKTIPFTYSLFILASAIIVFIYVTMQIGSIKNISLSSNEGPEADVEFPSLEPEPRQNKS